MTTNTTPAPAIKFGRIAAGHYMDRATGVEIKRDGCPTSRFDRRDWHVIESGSICRIEQTFAEAEMAAHKMIEQGRASGIYA